MYGDILAYARWRPVKRSTQDGRICSLTAVMAGERSADVAISAHRPSTQIFLSCNLHTTFNKVNMSAGGGVGGEEWGEGEIGGGVD